MDIKELLKMDGGEAIDWLIENQSKYVLVEKKREETRGMEMAEQQILGYHSARSGEPWKDLISGMGLTLDEYETMLDDGMIDYLSEDEKDEILSAIESA